MKELAKGASSYYYRFSSGTQPRQIDAYEAPIWPARRPARAQFPSPKQGPRLRHGKAVAFTPNARTKGEGASRVASLNASFSRCSEPPTPHAGIRPWVLKCAASTTESIGTRPYPGDVLCISIEATDFGGLKGLASVVHQTPNAAEQQ